MQLSFTEENYLKAIYKIHEKTKTPVNTNAIADDLATTAASVTDMIKKLAEKNLVIYEKYKGVILTSIGESRAIGLIRKHRLWEVFLVDTLDFTWDEVHDIAEQLEHIESPVLIKKLDAFLGYPKFDPHGDAIPDEEGNYHHRQEKLLSDMLPLEQGVIVGVKDHTTAFLQYLNLLELTLGKKVEIKEVYEYDKSISIQVDGLKTFTLSYLVSKNIVISKNVG